MLGVVAHEWKAVLNQDSHAVPLARGDAFAGAHPFGTRDDLVADPAVTVIVSLKERCDFFQGMSFFDTPREAANPQA